MVKKTEDISEMFAFIVDNMATKDDIANMATKDDIVAIREEMATKDDIANMATKDDIVAIRAEMATKDDIAAIRQEMATKTDLENMEDRIMAELRPMARAQDKDAETIIDHERCISKLERQSAVA